MYEKKKYREMSSAAPRNKEKKYQVSLNMTYVRMEDTLFVLQICIPIHSTRLKCLTFKFVGEFMTHIRQESTQKN